MKIKVQKSFLVFLIATLLSCTEDSVSNDNLVSERYQEGTHYSILKNPTATRDPSVAEVVEVFWFGCNHCYTLEPYIQRWKSDLTEEVYFYKSPATWNEILKIHARIFYTAKALGIEGRFVPAAFNTIQVEKKPLTGNSELEYYFRGFGIEREKYKAVSRSFGVNNAVKQADKRMRQWGVNGVPTLIVNGKYSVSASRDLPTNQLFEVVDFLIEKERQYSSSK